MLQDQANALSHLNLDIFQRFAKIKGSPLEPPARDLPPVVIKQDTHTVRQLPLWIETQRGIPNWVLRCSIFAALGRCHRQKLNDVVVAGQGGYVVRFSGEQLGQEDLDVWAGLLLFGRETLADKVLEVRFSAGTFLRHISRGQGKSAYVWLKQVLDRLSSTAAQADDRANSWQGRPPGFA
jgi:hypothetical protein